MFGLSQTTIIILSGTLLLVPVAFYLGHLLVKRQDSDQDARAGESFPPTESDGTDQQVVELQPPKMQGSRFGLLGQIWKVWRYLKKREKLAGRGYVQWYFVDDAFPTPKFVKPTDKGGGTREIEHEGGIYLFPDAGGVPAAEQGIWTYFHARGEPRPISMREPEWPGMSAEAVKEYATMRVTSSPPSFMDKFNLSGEDAVKYALAAGIGITMIMGAMGGGF